MAYWDQDFTSHLNTLNECRDIVLWNNYKYSTEYIVLKDSLIE